jgi:hypothetical protein
MAEEPQSRPLSGEIMADAGQRPRRSPGPCAGVTDAEFETIPARTDNRIAAASGSARSSLQADGLDLLRPEEARNFKLFEFKRGGWIFWSFGFAVVAICFWISGGHVLFGGQEPGSLLRGLGPTVGAMSGGFHFVQSRERAK